MTYKILIPEKIADEGISYLTERGYEIKRGSNTSGEAFAGDLLECDGVIVRSAKVDEAVIKRCERLKVIAKHGVGVDNIDLEAAKKHGKRVVFTPDANACSVAEHAMMLILACAKRLLFMAGSYATGDFAVKNKASASEVRGKTLGLAGIGRIGSLVANMAKYGFGMNILVYDPYVTPERLADGIELARSWDELWTCSDFVSIHMPLTEETEKCVGGAEFALMKSTAYLVNTARGGIVDESALIKALECKKIAGAGLDVTEPEPAHKDNPLFCMDNVILTPHCASGTLESLARMAVDAAQGIDEVLSGRSPSWPIV